MGATEEEGTIASTAEVEAAIGALSLADNGRLKLYAKKRIALIGRAARGRSSDDLLQDALLAILSGRRHWKKSAVDFVGLMAGAMKSISSGWAAGAKTIKHGEPLYECELIREDEDGKASSMLDLAKSPSPSQEAVAIGKDCVTGIRRFFCDDPLILDIMDGLAGDLKGPEICQVLSITEKEYRAAVRRMERNCPRIDLEE